MPWPRKCGTIILYPADASKWGDIDKAVNVVGASRADRAIGEASFSVSNIQDAGSICFNEPNDVSTPA